MSDEPRCSYMTCDEPAAVRVEASGSWFACANHFPRNGNVRRIVALGGGAAVEEGTP